MVKWRTSISSNGFESLFSWCQHELVRQTLRTRISVGLFCVVSGWWIFKSAWPDWLEWDSSRLSFYFFYGVWRGTLKFTDILKSRHLCLDRLLYFNNWVIRRRKINLWSGHWGSNKTMASVCTLDWARGPVPLYCCLMRKWQQLRDGPLPFAFIDWWRLLGCWENWSCSRSFWCWLARI